MIKKGIILFFTVLFITPLSADEGMWIPLLLKKYNIDDMQDEGLQLNAEDIYSINSSSIKDAVVIFGGGCTGEVVSGEGLVFTNHHCGYSYIQSLSSVENDYLTNGYWAMNRKEELPAPGLSVRFLIRIENVTNNILKGIKEDMTENQRRHIVQENIEKVISRNLKETHYQSVIKPFYYGAEYYMFIYEEFTDIRLVGTPPEAIGNFGSDLDNWMWPRHTGDFSVFRIYANSENKPADYSPDNIPYTPNDYLPVSLQGIDHKEFTFIMGYPGTTHQYYISDGVERLKELSFPHKIKLRDNRLEIMERYMKKDDRIRLQYASKYKSVSNSWKKWKGIILGMNRVNAIDSIRAEEEKFLQWVAMDPERQANYGSVIFRLRIIYNQLEKFTVVYDYLDEAVLASELYDFSTGLFSFIENNHEISDQDKYQTLQDYINSISDFYKDYYLPIDKEITIAMLQAFYNDIDPEFHPDIFTRIEEKYRGDIKKYVNKLYRKTNFSSEEKLLELLSDYPEKEDRVIRKLSGDMMYELYYSFASMYSEKVFGEYFYLNNQLDQLYRKYVRGIREMHNDKPIYPDANFTMRLTYGQANGYKPKDGVYYDYFTTLSGKVDKFHLGYEDYTLPEKLLDLFISEDYGPYADEDGNLRVCFIATNHTSGGNSGSPVMNANGELIGLNFDRSWEGTMSDLYYDASICRNISVDIRYVLFIIDKFAGAGYLLNEMKIIR